MKLTEIDRNNSYAPELL